MRSSLFLALAATVLSAGSAWAGGKFGYDKQPIGLDMFNQPSLKTQEQPVTYPANTVSTRGREPAAAREETDGKLTNPLAPTPESIAEGRWAFAKNCAACHGLGAHSNTPVAAKFGQQGAVLWDLTLTLASRTDGFLYGTIRNGGIKMPGYGAQASEHDRWAIVNYLRSLQPK